MAAQTRPAYRLIISQSPLALARRNLPTDRDLSGAPPGTDNEPEEDLSVPTHPRAE